MKKNPGKIILLFLLLCTYLHANNLASYQLISTKSVVHEKEPFSVNFIAKQQDHSDNMMFLLKPKKSPNYTIKLLNKSIDDKVYHNNITRFTFLVIPLKATKLHVGFDFTIQTASDKAVANSYVDDHDDSIAIETYNTTMPVAPLAIEVKPLTQDVDLVGDFTLKQKLSHAKMDQYGSINIVYTLEGEGYEAKKITPLKDIKGVTIFSEVNDILRQYSKYGKQIKREYIYALSAKKSFTIPSISLKAYSPKSDKYYTLTTKTKDVTVTQIDTSTLIDNEEYPLSTALINLDGVKNLFIYIIIFLSGYFSAKFQPSQLSFLQNWRVKSDLDTINTPKDLLYYLVKHHYQEVCKKEVEHLEEIVYFNKEYNFKSIKKSVQKKVER